MTNRKRLTFLSKQLFCSGGAVFLCALCCLLYVSWSRPLVTEPSAISPVSSLSPVSSVSKLLTADNASTRTPLNRSSNVAVVSLSIPVKERVLVSEWNHWLYAQRHGYSYFSNHRNDDFGDSEYPKHAKAHFQKPAIIRRLLNDRNADGNYSFDFVFWIDSDALFIDCQRSLAQVWKSGLQKYGANDNADDIGILLSAGELAGLNSGVILLRNCQWTRQFVDTWYRVSNAFTVENRFTLLRFNDQSTLALIVTGVSEKDLILENEKESDFRKRVENMAKKFEIPILQEKIKDNKNKAIAVRKDYFAEDNRKHILLADYSLMNANGAMFEGHLKRGRVDDFIVHIPGIIYKDKDAALRKFALSSTCLNLFLDSTSVH